MTIEYFESSRNLENLELECGPARPNLLETYFVPMNKSQITKQLICSKIFSMIIMRQSLILRMVQSANKNKNKMVMYELNKKITI